MKESWGLEAALVSTCRWYHPHNVLSLNVLT